MAASLKGYERYRAFIDSLNEHNVDEYIDLPQIAVMGDTSSGKSSLLSNISLVELPSNDNLTTRCPIMLRMHHAASKSATVKVSWKDKPAGDNVDFTERSIDEKNWDTITTAIADAQSHIIQKSGKEVARDIVVVDMKGPHCENLTLIDLPGIVRTSGKEESKTLAEDITALMNDYLSNPLCVILAVMPCNVDYHNSQILADARKVDPETQRTIPVLTKPDLIDDGAQASVKKLLLGMQTDTFQMGFHMMKGRGQKALNKKMSIEEGLQEEESFFANTEPWRGIEDKNLLGTKNLRSKLANVLMELIRSSFKDIISKLKDQHAESLTSYEAFGEVPSNLAEKRSLFRSVKEEISKQINATTLDGRIGTLHNDVKMRPSAKFHDASETYMDILYSSKLANISKVTVGTKVIAIYEGEEIRGEVCFIDEKKGLVYLKDDVEVQNISTQSVINLKKNEPGNIIQYSGNVYIERDDGTIDELNHIPDTKKLVRADPEWLADLIKQNRPYKLPIFINTYVFDAIVANLIEEEWAQPTMDLLNFTSKLMDTAAEEFIKEAKKTTLFPLLQSYLITKATEVVECVTKETSTKVKEFVEREKVPYTQNHYLFENVCKLRSERLMNEVLSSLPLSTSTNGLASINAASLRSTVKNVFQRNQERSVDDHMAEEMQNALNSYGKVALKRFIDNVPMLCIEIMQNFADKMNDVLSEVVDEDIERIVVAPSNIATERNQLKRKADTLERGIVALRDLF